MSYVVLSTIVDEIDLTQGFLSGGQPKRLIGHAQGTTFTPQGASRSVSDAATTINTPTLTSATAAFSSPADVGRSVAATGIPGGTTISSVTNATTAVMSANATATGSALNLTIGASGSFAQVAHWVSSGAIQAVGNFSVASVAPTHAPPHGKCAITGTGMGMVNLVTMKLTAAAATAAAVPCQTREASATSVAFIVPLVPAGAYTVTAWIGNYVAGTVALTVDAVPT